MMAAPMRATAAAMASRAVLTVTSHLLPASPTSQPKAHVPKAHVQGVCRPCKTRSDYPLRLERWLNARFIWHSDSAGRSAGYVQGPRLPVELHNGQDRGDRLA